MYSVQSMGGYIWLKRRVEWWVSADRSWRRQLARVPRLQLWLREERRRRGAGRGGVDEVAKAGSEWLVIIGLLSELWGPGYADVHPREWGDNMGAGEADGGGRGSGLGGSGAHGPVKSMDGGASARGIADGVVREVG